MVRIGGVGLRARSLCTALALVAAAVPSLALPAQAAPRARTGSAPLLVADLGPLSADERLVFAALQGIVNRRGPRVYLEGMDETAGTWRREAIPLATAPTAPYDLVRTFRNQLRGLVVWDPSLAVDTQNVATTVAGQRDLLPVSPALARVLARRPYRLPIK